MCMAEKRQRYDAKFRLAWLVVPDPAPSPTSARHIRGNPVAVGEPSRNGWTRNFRAGVLSRGRRPECPARAIDQVTLMSRSMATSQPVVQAIDRHDVAWVLESVEDGGGEEFVTEHVIPFTEGLRSRP
ncbi:hypothetical protein GCM10010431_73110 [Streptomyces kunmingensis]